MSELSEPIAYQASEESLLNRLASVRVRVGWLALAFGLILLIGTGMRFWDLGSRALHHDESLHAWTSWRLFVGEGYDHQPWMHGPFQFFGTALTFFLFGITDYASRIFPALFGSALIALPFFLRNRLGTAGALLAGVAIAVSPTLLYFSRFARNDVYIAFFVLGLVVLMWRYIDDRKPQYLYLTGLLMGLAFATKESIFINAAVLLAFLNFWIAFDFWRQVRDHNKLDAIGGASLLLLMLPLGWAIAAFWPFLRGFRERLGLTEWHPAADLLIVLGTLTLPQFAALAQVPVKGLFGVQEADLAKSFRGDQSYENALGLLTIFAMIGASAFIGLRWNARAWALAALAFYVPYSLLYTSFFTEMDGFYSGHWGALDYWLGQQDVARGQQPWFYYLMLLPVYEFLPLVIAAPAVFYFAVRGDAFERFLVFWFFGTIVGFSVAGEKMPWLSVNTALPLVILAAHALGRLLTAAAGDAADPWYRPYLRPAGAAAIGLLAVAVALFGPEGGGWVALRVILILIAIAWIIALLFGFDVRQLSARPEKGRRVFEREPTNDLQIAAVVASAVAGGLLAMTLFTAVRVTYQYGDVPRELLVYTQTSPYVVDIVEAIDESARQSGLGEDLPIYVDGGIEPWVWYLRDYKQVKYQAVGAETELPAGAVVISLATNEAAVDPHLADYQAPIRFPLRWWYPQFDTYGAVPTADVIRFPKLDTLPRFADWFIGEPFRSSSWDTWWDYWRYRIPPNTPGSVDDRLGRLELIAYFPKEFDVPVPDVSTPDVDAPPDQPPVQTEVPPAADLPATQLLPVGVSFGGEGSGAGQLREPGGMTIDAQGNIYVTEVANHRVQKFDPEGNLLAQVGGQGSGDGQFFEPWGVTTDAAGNVYVADTFNHRIQKFDSDLNYLSQWGKPASNLDTPEDDAFWGPRDVAVDANGDVWVADGGTNRVLKYSPEGELLAVHGSRGGGPGQFVEPTSIEVAAAGDLLVSDSGNRRVQRFDAGFAFLAEYAVPGWLYVDSIVKPYVVALPDGGLIASDPTQNVLIRFDAAGAAIAALDAESGSLALPRGIALDAAGNLWVAEATTHQVRQLILAEPAP
jgi:uncharacterized protein (TIGR03663 family)